MVEQPQRLSKERNLDSLGTPIFDNGLQGLTHIFEVIIRFWNDKMMIFQFGDVEITPTIEEIKDYLDSIGTSSKRKKHPDHHILLPDRPNSLELKDMLVLVNANWLDTKSVSLMRFFERWEHDSYFKKIPNEFYNHSTWRQTQTIAFSACLFGQWYSFWMNIMRLILGL